ncbi:MAG: hypothetical protein ACI9DF_005228 [Verrucomicrobiales bacterium]
MLNIFSDDGLLDSEDPIMGTNVPVTLSPEAAGLKVSVSGLKIVLPAGDYWFGLTPILEFATLNQEYHQSGASLAGSVSHARNEGGGFGVSSDWQPAVAFGVDPSFDAALTIESRAITARVPPPSAALSLIALQMIVITRRRRRRRQ